MTKERSGSKFEPAVELTAHVDRKGEVDAWSARVPRQQMLRRRIPNAVIRYVFHRGRCA
jgi:hypothetical protein